MLKRIVITFYFLPLLLIQAQNRTVGLIKYPVNHTEMYYLFTPLSSKSTFLIDDCGNLINKWNSNYTSGAFQLITPDGHMIRCGTYLPPRFGPGAGGVLEKFDWDGNIIWKGTIADTGQSLHHDIKLMPNGNILAIVWVNKPIAVAKAAGRKASLALSSVWSEKIIEIKPIGSDSFDIVWEWNAWDHIIQDEDSSKPNFGVVSEHPELLDINFVGNIPQDWLHANSVDYNEILDQIVISLHSTDEIIIIDHSTSTAQAAGHSGGKYGKGGDILYRWGNPQAYDRGNSASRRLYKQHHAHWIPAGFADSGKIMIFNNGMNRPGGNYSSLDIIAPPQISSGVYTDPDTLAYGPELETVFFKDSNPSKYYSVNLSGAYHIPGGNVLSTLGASGTFVEVDGEQHRVWEYVNPVGSTKTFSQGEKATGNGVFRCIPYPKNFSGFSGKSVTPKGEIELSPLTPSLCVMASARNENSSIQIEFFPNPVADIITLNQTTDQAKVLDLTGKILTECTNCSQLDFSRLKPGTYILQTQIGQLKNSAMFIHQ